jgi:phospholipid/cholesterol/gamma-HCH transport system substrate-binding protein
MDRVTFREVLMGLVVLGAISGLGLLMVLAADGPGFLGARRVIDVEFRDAMGLRPGCAVRVAGLDAGRVTNMRLVDREGLLMARARLSLSKDLADRLKQDARITVQTSLTGQTTINIVGTGKSDVPLVAGQVVRGYETSLFDPVLEQVGLGPAERNHLSRTIEEVANTVDAAGPRLRQILASLEETAEGFHNTADSVRPVVESTARRIDQAMPKVEDTLDKLSSLTGHAELLLGENRNVINASLRRVDGLLANVNDVVVEDRKKVEDLIDGLSMTRQRLDRVLYNTDQITTQGASIMTQRRADIDRVVTNVRDATAWGDKTIQKIYGNPFYLSPLYKPNNEDIRAQATFDAAQNFTMGARELHDAVKSIQALQQKQLSQADRQRVDQLYKEAATLTQQINQAQAQIAEGLRANSGPRQRVERR